MKTRALLIVAGCLLLLAGLAGCGQNNGGIGRVSGTIVSFKTGEPVFQAEVTLFSSGTGAMVGKPVYTGPEGKFMLEAPPGMYLGRVRKSGYEERQMSVEIKLNTTTAQPDCLMTPEPGTVVIRGEVVFGGD